METPITRKDALKLGAAAGVAFSATGLLPRAAKAASVGVGSKPSILLIVVDDMPDRLLEVMETVQSRIMTPGTRFLNAYTAIPLCGPNRAAILTGMFPHTSGVKSNSAYSEFKAGNHEPYTFVKALNDGGYDTGLFGKYMNGRGAGSTMTDVPAGWDRWFEVEGSSQQTGGFDASNDGVMEHYDETYNDSQVAHDRAKTWIQNRQPATRPFFCQYSPTNPHNPFTPTATHALDYDNQPKRDAPSVNEADMSDKPAIMQNRSPIDEAKLENYEEGMREELEDTDDFVADLIDAAEAVTGNSNLLIIFTSDNGIQVGEHRLIQKSWPYQESIEIPLIMRGTNLPAQEPTQLVSSVDIYGTILKFAGVAPPRGLDGRSLDQIVMGIQPASWRKRVLIENPVDRKWQMYREFQPAAGKDFAFIRRLPSSTDPNPESEYYDLNLTMDPYQLNSTPSKVTQDMSTKLDRLTSRTGANLRAVEEEASTTQGGDPWPTVRSTVPGPDAKGVATTTNVTATFSEAMLASSINGTTFKLFKKGSTTKIAATVSYDPTTRTATLNPFGSTTTRLARGTTYKAVVTTGAKDMAGNSLDQNPSLDGLQQKTWFFTTTT